MLRLFTGGRVVLFAAVVGFIFGNHLFAQNKTLTRRYEPVVIAAGKLPAITNDTIKVFTAYRYINGNFEPVRFQIDKVDKDGKFLRESGAIADTNDQVVFMPEETGDLAPTDKWVDGSADVRIELEVAENQLTNPNEKGWLYLFRNVKNPSKPTPLVRYSRGSVTGGADTVFATSYIEAHDTQGWFTDTRIRQPYGNGDNDDILDRQKVRVDGRLLISVNVNERDHLKYRYLRSNGLDLERPPVRVLREYGITVSIAVGPISFVDSTGSFFTEYFPYNTVFSAQNVKIPTVSGLTVDSVRQSVDLSDRAVGMKFYNAFNSSGFMVDGAPDSPVKTITDSPDGWNWLMFTGNQGTIVTLMDVPLIGSRRKLYFADNLTPTTNTKDTGDLKSYGDTGVTITSPAQGSSFSFKVKTYYVEKNQVAAFGGQFKQRELRPMQVKAVKQTRTISAVLEQSHAPTTFALDDALPNPFAPQRGFVRIGFDLGATSALPSLRIFNVLGQEVVRFEGVDLRRNHAVLWDGRDRSGRIVPAGVYFYQLEAGRQRAVKKLVLVR
jgi:hypothetical protein